VTSPSIADVQADDGTMLCYRHPDREVWIRCGRCDRPICTQCAMQGPVGFRCKQCGGPFPLEPLLVDAATWALITAGAAAVGAWSRLR
jgi:hypothetical membrane protein